MPSDGPPGLNSLGVRVDPEPMVIRCDTRSGCTVVRRIAVMPPIELPTSAAFSMPSASMKSMCICTWSDSSYVVV